MTRIIAQGAEAMLRQEGPAVIKERISKGYRIKQIDEALRRKRTKLEARLIREARRAGVQTPQILEEDEFSIKMELIKGKRVKEAANSKNCKKIAGMIGEAAAKLHNYNIIHGDLTTSNMIISKGKSEGGSTDKSAKKPQRPETEPAYTLYLIDFGLGLFSQRAEDKATDLHVLKEVITATHFDIAAKLWPAVLATYSKNYDGSSKVIKALSKIEKRGRYVKRGK